MLLPLLLPMLLCNTLPMLPMLPIQPICGHRELRMQVQHLDLKKSDFASKFNFAERNHCFSLHDFLARQKEISLPSHDPLEFAISAIISAMSAMATWHKLGHLRARAVLCDGSTGRSSCRGQCPACSAVHKELSPLWDQNDCVRCACDYSVIVEGMLSLHALST